MRVSIVEDEPHLAEAVRDGLRLEAIAADFAGDGDTAQALMIINAYDIAALGRDAPSPSGDEIAASIVAKASGFELQELVLRLRALDRRRAHNRPPVREIPGLRLDPYRREVFRDGRYVAQTRKRFTVLEAPGTGREGEDRG